MGVHSPPKRYRTFGPLWLVVAGLVCLVGAGTLLANVVGFLNHSSRKGAQAIAQIETRVEPNSSTSQSNTVSCVGAQGLLEIPAIHLLAPVEPGTLQSTLAYAVGHVSVSPEPGQMGTAVFAAHDVTWFHRISSLSPGDTILYYSACQVLKYVVTAHEVVGHSYAIPNLPAGLALFTCWPLDALWETSQRYVVQATLVGGYRSTRVPKLTTANPSYTAYAPGQLGSLDTLAANPTPLGDLSVIGPGADSFSSSPAALDASAAAQGAYFALLRALEDPSLAPPNSYSANLLSELGAVRKGIKGYASPLDTSVSQVNGRVQVALLKATVTLLDGSQVHLSVTETVSGNMFSPTEATVRSQALTT